MLVSNLIASYQESYADIQAKLDELQQQQKEIQAYLQQLDSVESQVASALQMLQEAIAAVNEVCPDRLATLEETITGLFPRVDSTPTPTQDKVDSVARIIDKILELEPEPEPESAPAPEPERTSNVVQFPTRTALEAEPLEALESEPIFKYSISHYGNYVTYWRQDELVTQMFKTLKIRPKDRKISEGYNPFGGDGVAYVGYLTRKAFAKIEDKAFYLDADILD